MKDDTSILQIFFITFAIAISLSATSAYLIFYARDFVTKITLESIHYTGILLMIYVTAYVFVLSEMRMSEFQGLMLASLGLFFVISTALIFTFSENSRYIAWGLTFLVISVLLLYDYFGLSGKR